MARSRSHSLSVVAWAFVLALASACVDVADAESLSDDSGNQSVSSLSQRMNQLEAALFRQDEMLRVQKQELSSQRSSVRQLKQTVHSLQTDNLKLKETVDSLQTDNLQLKETAHSLQTDNRQLKGTVHSLQLDSRQLKHTISHLQMGHTQRHAPVYDSQADDKQSVSVVKARNSRVPASTPTALRTTPAPSTDETGNLTALISQNDVRIQARGDDVSPLEAVVDQMDQQLTQLLSDLQAFKTQTATDMQAVRTQASANYSSLQDADDQLVQMIHDAGTSTYVHWGSSQCGNSSQLVYSGVVGGSMHSHSGAATNNLCVTLSPVLSDHRLPPASAFLYGAEYETQDSSDNKDAVCAVCRSSHSTTIMIPGTNVCSSGWQEQYSGFLMAGYYTSSAGSEYICVDSALETRPGSFRDDSARQLLFTVTRCGSLPCGPYIDGKVVMCVVCSQ